MTQSISADTFERIARTVHEALSAWQVANGGPPYTAWDAASDEDRQSTYDSVRYVIEHPGASAADQHDQWVQKKRASGWVFGEIRDAAAKRHPMLRPYAEISGFEQSKDALLNAIVQALYNPETPG